MDKSYSALFAGLRFDKKRFATDVARFEPKAKEELKRNEESEQPMAALTGTKMEKKRKRKRKEKVLDIVDGFSLFKSSESSLVGGKGGKLEYMEDDSSEQRKEAEKQIEQVALLRKKYGLHISGCNVPSPLQSFAELRSRYHCKSYLLHKLTELGFEEPTPIQRQAIPILLSGQECFACAPTGSGKTLAFLFPILMKIKDPRMASKL